MTEFKNMLAQTEPSELIEDNPFVAPMLAQAQWYKAKRFCPPES